MFSPRTPSIRSLPPVIRGLHPLVVTTVTTMLAVLASPASAEDKPAAGVAGLGVAIVPQDAAFVSSTLRIRRQYDAIVNSNAFAAIKALPAVQRALDSYEEQRVTPGSGFSVFETFLQLPENAEAAAVLADMVATDTFVYGEPSCISFARLLRLIAESQQRVEIEQRAEDDDEEEDEDADEEDTEEDGGIVAGELDFNSLSLGDGSLQTRQMIKALAANLDLLVVPDIVWGFHVTDRKAALSQLGRLEQFAQELLTGGDPELAKSLGRRKLARGEVLAFTLDGDRLPWRDFEDDLAAIGGDAADTRKVLERLGQLDLVVAVGVFGDWVILSIGDSIDHLEKLALPDSGRKGLLTLPALKPLLDYGDKPITGISYVSESLMESQATTAADLQRMLAGLQESEQVAELPESAREDIRKLAAQAAGEYAKLLPEPGAWTAVSFLTEQGYEGYTWDRSRNLPFDGSRRLDLLEHSGGAPLGVIVSRLASDPATFDAIVGIVGSAWSLFEKHGRPTLDADDGRQFDEFNEHIGPLARKLADILRTKIIASLADGQVGFVLDAKGRAKRIQEQLPTSADPLPVPEPAIVLPLADRKLFIDGLNDLFALGDEAADAIRDMDPDAVAAEYRVPEPEKTKLDGGSIWSWSLDRSRVDEQVRPAIGVGEDVVVFSLVPKQAARMIAEGRLETGSQLSTFEEPLAGAAALDFAGLIDVLQPWIVYATRYGCVQEREGAVEADEELSAEDENEQAKEILAHVNVVLEACKSLRAAVAETAFKDDVLVTHWRNVIRDMPANR
jgi:hypothetical protein